jgi:hypothetical protein
MRRPSTTREALSLSPLVKAGRADASSVECVPLVATYAEPFVLLARRPAAERAADARTGGVVALLFVEFTIQNRG